MKKIGLIAFLGGGLSTLLLLTIMDLSRPIPAQKKPRLKKKVNFFDSEEKPLSLHLTFDIDYFREINEGKRFYHKAMAKFSGSGGKEKKMAAEVKLRGQFRTDSNYCDMPQLKVRLAKKYRGINKFDLILPCQNLPDYQEYIFQEHLIYQLYQELSEYSYRVKLVKLQLKNSGATQEAYSLYAILQESDQDMEKRLEAEEIEALPIDNQIVNSLFRHRVSLFQYAIGNDDWSISALHNIKILEKQGELFPIPYDFDFAGLINTPYTAFDSSTYYAESSLLAKTPLAKFAWKEFKALKNAFLNKIDRHPFLSPSQKERSRDYLKDTFYLLERAQKTSSKNAKKAQ